MKKSEVLAIENAQRIAGKLREERNDALALAQTLRERVDAAEALLAEIRSITAPDVVEKIDAFLNKVSA